jgi:hypothetical protein
MIWNIRRPEGVLKSKLSRKLTNATPSICSPSKLTAHRYVVSSEDIQQQGAQGIGANKRTATMLGGGAALGTLIGAVAGGGKGAAVGALAGAAAGTGAEVLTKGKAVQVPAESKLRFKLDRELRLDRAY